jgi:hypothetical protein
MHSGPQRLRGAGRHQPSRSHRGRPRYVRRRAACAAVFSPSRRATVYRDGGTGSSLGVTGPLPENSVVECLLAGHAGSGCTSGSTSSVVPTATTCTGAAGGAAGSRALGWSTSRAAAERVKPALRAAAHRPLSCRVRAPVAALSLARARSHAPAGSRRSTRGDRSAGSACHRRPPGRGRSSSRRRGKARNRREFICEPWRRRG